MALLDSTKVSFAALSTGSVTGSNAVEITSEDSRINPNVASGEFKLLNGKLGNKETWRNDDDVTSEVSIESFIRGNDDTALALDTLPAWSEIYKTCALAETVDTGTVGQETVTYTPSQTAPASAEVALWRDGFKRVLTNSMGSLTVSGTVGEPLSQAASIMGFTTITSAAEANPSLTISNELIILKSTDTMTFTGTAYKGRSFTLNQGNDIQKFYAVGTKEYERIDYDSTLEIMYLKENEAIYADFAAGTEHTVIIKAGASSGKAMQITAAQAEVASISESSDNGKEAVTVVFNLKGDATGENQFAIKYGYFA